MEKVSWIISERIARGRSHSGSTVADNRAGNSKRVSIVKIHPCTDTGKDIDVQAPNQVSYTDTDTGTGH